MTWATDCVPSALHVSDQVCDMATQLSCVAVFSALLWFVVRASIRTRRLRARTDKSVVPPPSQTRGTGQSIPCINPATEESLGPDEHACTPKEVRDAVARGRVAQQQWAQTSFTERSAVLHDLIQYVIAHQDEIAKLSCSDSGKTFTEAVFGEIMTTCEKARWTAKFGADALKPESRSVPTMLLLKKARVEYHPMGVLGIIVPWNYPFHNVASAAISAIFSGNAALIKVSEHAAHTRQPFEDVFRTVLARRGHNPDLVQLVTGYGETGSALVTGGVDKVLFIGSPAVGKLVMKAASSTLTPVILELGGKDPMVICDDAHLEHAAGVASRGSFINCGQNCIAAERVYVQDAIYDRFVARITAIVDSIRQGADPLDGSGGVDVGAICMKQQIGLIDELVQDAVAQGATLVRGGKRKPGKGQFYEPTLLTNVTNKMRIVQEEVFGPVMIVLRWSTDDEVVSLTNDSDFALGSSIFSGSLRRAERLAKRITAGMVVVNDFGVGYLIQGLPFGGVKDSGFGCFNGFEGLRGFCRQKSVVTDRFPGMLTHTPAFASYPYSNDAPQIVKHALAMIYGRGLGFKASNLFGLLRTLIFGGKAKAPSKKTD